MLNDADPGIAAYHTSVIRHPAALKQRVREFQPTVTQFYAIREELRGVTRVPDEPEAIVDLGSKKLFVHRISYGGLGVMAGGPQGGLEQAKETVWSRWRPKTICKRIDRDHALFAGVQVRGGCCTALDFQSVIDDQSCPAFIYLDPPYYMKGRDLYLHGFTEADHVRLATCLRATPHPWLLSYDDSELVRDLYRWADIRPLTVRYSLRRPKKTTELIIVPRSMALATTVAHRRPWKDCPI